MTAGEVTRVCLRRWNLFKDHIIPRCCLTGWEADILVIKPSGWCKEIEIKVSVGDFRSEWKKKAEKHEGMRLGVRRQVGSDWSQSRVLDGVDVSADPTLHWVERWPRTGTGYWYVRRPGIIRRFWFAMPEELAERLLPEVPEEYGVLAVGRWARPLREPTNLKMARKITDAERIHALESTYTRFWQQQLRECDRALEALMLEAA